MATLTGQTIASSYEQLLSLPDGGGNGTNLVAITDGDAGTTFALQLATDKAQINGALTIDANATDGTSLTIDSEAQDGQGIYMDVSQQTSGYGIIINDVGTSRTTGGILYINSNQSGTGTRNLVEIINNHTNATGTTALKIQQDSTAPALVALGNVGIGTASPSSRLHLYNLGDATNNELLIECDSSSGGATGNQFLTMKREDTNRANEIKFVTQAHSGSAVHKFSLGQTDSDETGVDGTEFYIGRASGGANPDFTISSAGDLGIGIAPNANFKTFLYDNTNSADAWALNVYQEGAGGNGTRIDVESTDASDFILQCGANGGSTEVLNVIASGNVGIGTTAPEASLDILNGQSIALQLGGDSGADSLTNSTRKFARIGAHHYTNAEEPVGIAVVDSNSTHSYLTLGGGSGSVNNATHVRIAASSATNSANGADFRMIIDANSRISLSNNDSGGTGGSDSTSGNSLFGHLAGASIASGGLENTFYGHKAGNSITTGDGNTLIGSNCATAWDTESNNTAIGYDAMNGGVNGAASCVAVGKSALASAHTQTGTIAIGESALGACTSGAGNVAVGFEALLTEDSGSYSTAIGHQALKVQNVDNANNVAIGYNAAVAMTTGKENVIIGSAAGDASQDIDQAVVIGSSAMGNGNATSGADGTVAIGKLALFALTSGDGNVAVGYETLDGIQGAHYNTAVGYQALTAQNTNGNIHNTGIGNKAGLAITSGIENTAVGSLALSALVSGNYNTAVGKDALSAVEGSASNNIGIGRSAGYNITTGGDNTVVGRSSSTGAADSTNATVIGHSVVGLGSNTVTLGDENVTAVYMAQDSGAVVHAGGLLIGASSQVASSQLTIEAVDYPFMSLRNTATSDGSGKIGGRLDFNFANGTSKPTVANDVVGQMVWIGQGNDADYASAAVINTITTGGDITRANQVSKLEFQTKNSGANGCATRLTIAGDGTFTGSSSNDISDERLKENITNIDSGLDTINKLQGRTFTWKEEADMSKGTKYGLIAQELEKVLPDLVYNESGIRQKEDGEYYKSITMNGIIPVLIEAVKLSAKVTELESKLK